MYKVLEPTPREVVQALLELQTAKLPRNRTPVFTPLRSTSPGGDQQPARTPRHIAAGHYTKFLKATVTATPADAGGQASTIQHVDLVRRIQSNPQWTPADVLNRNFVELQNRWSASLAMSTDGSFPSRPRQNSNLASDRRS